MTNRLYGYDETEAGVFAVVEESGITKQKQANLLRKIADQVEYDLALDRLHKKKINEWYNTLDDFEQRRLVGNDIIRSTKYNDQNYGLWSYLRPEDRDRLTKFRNLNPDYPMEDETKEWLKYERLQKELKK